jgi:hypothetical protein
MDSKLAILEKIKINDDKIESVEEEIKQTEEKIKDLETKRQKKIVLSY